MADNERVEVVTLRFRLLESELKRYRREIGLMAKDLDLLAEAEEDIAPAAKQAQNAIRQQSQAVSQAERAYKDLRGEINKTNEAGKRSDFGGLARVGRLASGAGAGGVGQAFGLADDIIDAAEALPALKEAIIGLGPAGLLAAGAVVAMSVAIAEFNKQIEAGKQGLSAALNAQNAYYEALQSGTTESVSRQLKDLNDRRPFLERQITETQNALDSAFAQAAAQFGDAAARALDVAGQLPTAQLREQLTALQREYDGSAQTANRLETALKDGSLAANDAAAAEAELAAIRQANTDRQIQNEIRVLSNLNQSTKSIDARLEAINREQEVLRSYLDAGNLSADMTERLQQQLTDLGTEESLLAIRIRPLIDAREQEAEAIEYQKKQLEEAAGIIRQYNADVEALEARSLEERAALQERYNDQLIAIAEKAADAAANALAKLEEERAKLAAEFAQNERDELKRAQLERLDLILDDQREEAKAARQHARDLRKIREDAQEREFELALNRDFAGLFFSRRNTTKAIRDANEQYEAERQERRIALNEQIDDLVRHYAQEREQRFAQYQQDLADAQAQYERERVQIETNRRKELQKAQQSYNQDLTALGNKLRVELIAKRNAYEADLQLVSQTAQIRAQILNAELEHARSILAAISGASGGSNSLGAPYRRALGGPLSVGQSALVNERRVESFSSGGRTADFPNSLGIFTPLRGGRVNAQGGKSLNYSPVYNISGSGSPAQNEALVNLIDQRTRRTIREVFVD